MTRFDGAAAGGAGAGGAALRAVLVVGLGSADRGDDGVGPAVVAAVGSALRSPGSKPPPGSKQPARSEPPPPGVGLPSASSESIHVSDGSGVGNVTGSGFHGAFVDRFPHNAVEVATLADPTVVIDLMRGRSLVVVVDAVRSGAAPGTVVVRSVGAGNPVRPIGSGGTSTHGLGLSEALALARALDALPDRLVVVGVEASGFDPGVPMSPAVVAALPAAVAAVLDLIAGDPLA